MSLAESKDGSKLFPFDGNAGSELCAFDLLPEEMMDFVSGALRNASTASGLGAAF